MAQQIVQVPLTWPNVVFRTKPYQAFLRDKRCQRLLQTCHHNVDPKVELLAVNQKWVIDVLLSYVLLLKSVAWNIPKLRNNENPAAFTASSRLDDETLLRVLRHVLFQLLLLFWQNERLGYEVVLVGIELSRTSHDLCEGSLVATDTDPRQTIHNRLRRHYLLVVYHAQQQLSLCVDLL